MQCKIAGVELHESIGAMEEDEETFQDALEEMEDFWQRDGVPPCALPNLYTAQHQKYHSS
jgi:hypothetical protein